MGRVRKRLAASKSSASLTIPIGGELWMVAEERAQEILSTLQPVYSSDKSRYEIVQYIQNLIKDRLGFEVFFFGSVPLKTYLPDGDVDMTVITPRDKEDESAKALLLMLEAKSGDFDFPITDVQYVPAQVKVVKFNIRKISIDISFNQMSGLRTLCFLEQVDQMFGRDHLFKRSIILIKAWCYYESHILGANIGLFSTYGLAVLVLCIMNISYSSLSGPLSVLCKFLEYYASFDWDKYCITVNGPVLISSLPDITGTEHHEVHLNQKFFKACMETYSVPTNAAEANGPCFPVKIFNIMDPLKHSNNLGRSVSAEGPLARIKRALNLGARRLKDVLQGPGEFWKLEKFFRNSLAMNGKGQRQDVKEPVVAFGTGRSELSELRGDFDDYFHSLEYSRWFHGETQHNWMPQGQDTSSWNMAPWYVTGQYNNYSYWKNLNGSTSMQNMWNSRGTGSYIPAMVPAMCQQSYSDMFSSKPSTVNSLPSTSQTQLIKQNP